MAINDHRHSDEGNTHAFTAEKMRIAQLREAFSAYRLFYLEAVARGWSFETASAMFSSRLTHSIVQVREWTI
jgi:hypothetical protein